MLKPLKLFWRGLGIAAAIMFLTACVREDSNTVTDGREIYSGIPVESSTSQNAGDSQEVESKNLFVVKNINAEEKTVLLRDIDSGKELTLNYTGGTRLTDKYDSVIAMTQIKIGEIVESQYKEKESKLIAMKISARAWEYTNVNNLTVDRSEKNMLVGDDKYKYDESLILFSLDRTIDMMELNEQDMLTIKGYNRKICSIIVEKGHGYIRLENDAPFIGGWVEVGQIIVKPITKDMLIVAPEGDYKLTIASDGGGGFRSITVKRDEETVVDIGGFKGEVLKSGSVDFTITPEEGVLYINGNKTKTEELVVLEYGTYNVKVTAKGYESYTEKLVVDKTLVEKEITLESIEETETTETTNTLGNTDTGNTTVESSSSEVSDKYRIYIDKPEDAEVYFNGVYMGVAPVNFAKTSGTHTITLRKNGYENKSYTILINDDEEDARFSFSELTAE